MSVRSRLASGLYNIDRALSSLFGAGPQETISSQAGRAARRGKLWGRALCWLLNKIDPGHCADAVAHADKLDGADDGFIG